MSVAMMGNLCRRSLFECFVFFHVYSLPIIIFRGFRIGREVHAMDFGFWIILPCRPLVSYVLLLIASVAADLRRLPAALPV
jgi:hypothetical protein